MATFKKNLINIIILLATISAANATSIDYDDFREEYQDFNDESLNNVTEISNYDSLLFTTDELDALVSSRVLVNLKRLDLSRNPDLRDDHIIKLCENKLSFTQLNEINLSNCSQITVKSLETIRGSKFIGSVRNLPQISARYGCPSSEILVIIGGKTGVSREQKENKYILRSFAIEYKMSNGNPSPTFRPVKNGIKIINVKY